MIRLIALLAGALLLVPPAISLADDKEKLMAQGNVSTALARLNDFAADRNMDWFREDVQKATGIAIWPKLDYRLP
jgi:hypothetical protein